jgi:hypothetical protein
LAGPVQVAVLGSGQRAEELIATVRRSTSPGLVLAYGDPAGDPAGEPASEEDTPGLLADRGLLDGQPAAYVCRGFVCDRPVGTVADLELALGRRS